MTRDNGNGHGIYSPTAFPLSHPASPLSIAVDVTVYRQLYILHVKKRSSAFYLFLSLPSDFRLQEVSGSRPTIIIHSTTLERNEEYTLVCFPPGATPLVHRQG